MERLHKLQSIIQRANLDAIALIPGANLYYLTGVSFHMNERPFIAIIPAEGEAATIIPALEKQQFVESGLPSTCFAWTDAEGYDQAFADAIHHLHLHDKTIGVEGLRMRFKEGQLLAEQGLTVVDADDALIELRIVKTPDEIALMKKAVEISEHALDIFLTRLNIGMTEKQAAQLLSEIQAEQGGEGNAFTPIVLFGPRTALPHGMPGDTPLRDQDVVLIDFGTWYKGYPSDITRTFFVGEPSTLHRAVYETVLRANTTGRESARPNATGEALDTTTAQVLKDSEFAAYIRHRTGHGLGLEIHEHPNINQGSTIPLATGMTFTIEPGLYLEGEIGVRIEDNMVITADGAESLTSYPRELRVLQLS